jgi:carbamoyl-phosphate synthase large subunit
MPRRNDISKILLIGSGPIVIGQACEFDYSGTQGAKALRSLGYDVVLVNSNPATIMTDPELVRRTYIEPLTVETVAAIIERERPDALLPTLGGQTALNLALELHGSGVLSRHGVQLIGAQVDAIRKAEDRVLFKEAMRNAGLECARSGYATTVEEAREVVKTTGYPVILRPSFTMGGSGGAVVYRPEDLDAKVAWALLQSPTRHVLVEESLLGWKEYELEVIRDAADNFIVVCSIENIDPMGVHTGDSITVAPAMTLTDREYQRMRDAARAVMHEIGVETGGSNVQFAVDPATGRQLVIEMNPRVSRSSALASKATGYPIAKIAAKLAVGFTLDELENDMTGTSAAFEPTIDYVIVKWPRFAFEKFPGSDPRLGTQMKSVGEAMAIGRTFPEALQKAARSLETGKTGLVSLMDRVDYRVLARDPAVRDLANEPPPSLVPKPTLPPPGQGELEPVLEKLVAIATADRLFYVADALRTGITLERVNALTGIDPWFLSQIARILEQERAIKSAPALDAAMLRESKRLGFGDAQIAELRGTSEDSIRALSLEHGVVATYARVDTCAAEFPARTPYLYSSYESESEADVSSKKKVIILGGGPNRIGQGIEFDYCCCHAVFALRELGIETIMVNCNPETVSTDYDTSDRLYFEPLTLENVLSICREEAQKGELLGVIVQFGGQTPLKLAVPLERAGIRLLGTSADAIDRAEDRQRFDDLLTKLDLRRPRAGIAKSADEARAIAANIGYPVLVRPSYVLGGRAMMTCYSDAELEAYVGVAIEAAREEGGSQTLLIDQFLKNATEVDVDLVADGKQAVIGGVMQHIEEAGVHSGDSTSVLPPHTLEPPIVALIEENARKLAIELGVVGLMNVQFAVKDGEVYVLEVNPRASRTVPFVAKATGVPLAKIAAKVMAGRSLNELGVHDRPLPMHVAVKESVFPFAKFAGVDTILGPEMRSTGEVMGIALTFAAAFEKSLAAAGVMLPDPGRAFISVKEEDRSQACHVARRLRNLGFGIVATRGTATALASARIPAEQVNKVQDGSPHVVDMMREGRLGLVINTTAGTQAIADSYSIRRTALLMNLPYFTTMSAALAGVEALEAVENARRLVRVRSIQEWHARSGPAEGSRD